MPAKLNIICDEEYGKLMDGENISKRENHSGELTMNGATMVINGREVASSIKEAPEDKKYGAKVKHA